MARSARVAGLLVSGRRGRLVPGVREPVNLMAMEWLLRSSRARRSKFQAALLLSSRFNGLVASSKFNLAGWVMSMGWRTAPWLLMT